MSDTLVDLTPIKGITDRYDSADKELVESAYSVAVVALKDYSRGNGHPFIEHPVGVATIVANELGLMPAAVTAVFLHEATRANAPLLQEVTKKYPKEIIVMVEGLNNISTIRPKDTGLQAEVYRKLIISYSKDPRVALIKLADRLEIMRNLDIFPKSSVLRKNTETMLLYIPLAHQLGLYNIKSELEDIYFKYSDPENYRTITNKLLATEKDRERLVEEFVNPLKEKLAAAGIKYKFKVRTKTAYSIFKKMQKQNIPFEGVYDVFAIRFILKDVLPDKQHEHAACWAVYSLVTEEYKPHVERLRDWLSVPKPNGYESLHITVENRDGVVLEVQIRTERMDDMAENGMASHWSYKGVKRVAGLDDWLSNVKKMLESTDFQPYSSDEYTALKDVFVFTPDGDLKQLPQGATVLDFAFSIHTNLGVKCSGARVNGKVYSIRDTLKTGDVVEIISSKNQKPSADWLNIVVSSKAKNRIKAKLKEEQGKRIKDGREILERRMKNWKIELTDDVFTKILHQFKLKTVGDLCELISDEKIDLLAIKNLLLPADSGEKEDVAGNNRDNKTKESKEPENGGIKQDGDYITISDKLNKVAVQMARCCNPIFGDDAFAFVSASGGTKIHRISCPNAARLIKNYPYRVQPVKWQRTGTTARFQCGLKVIAENDPSIGPAVMDLCTKQNASVRSYTLNERNNGGKYELIIELSISVGNNSHLDSVISAIKRLREVKNVLRTRG